jgi:hypothetical protein
MRWFGNILLTRAYKNDHKALIVRPEKGERVDTLVEFQDAQGAQEAVLSPDGRLMVADGLYDLAGATLVPREIWLMGCHRDDVNSMGDFPEPGGGVALLPLRHYLMASHDGKVWDTPSNEGVFHVDPPDTSRARDFNLLSYGGYWWTMYPHHPEYPPVGERHFNINRSFDLLNWEMMSYQLEVPDPPFHGLEYGAIFAVEWFWYHGIPHALFSIQDTTIGGGKHRPYHAYPTKPDLSDWSAISCLVDPAGAFPTGYDPFIVEPGDGYWYMWFARRDTYNIEVWRSSAGPFSGYSAWKTGDWLGLGGACESEVLAKLADGNYRLYADRTGAWGTIFLDTTDGSLTTPPTFENWTTPELLKAPFPPSGASVYRVTDPALVTQIAQAVIARGPSRYSERFLRRYTCTPDDPGEAFTFRVGGVGGTIRLKIDAGTEAPWDQEIYLACMPGMPGEKLRFLIDQVHDASKSGDVIFSEVAWGGTPGAAIFQTGHNSGAADVQWVIEFEWDDEAEHWVKTMALKNEAGV